MAPGSTLETRRAVPEREKEKLSAFELGKPEEGTRVRVVPGPIKIWAPLPPEVEEAIVLASATLGKTTAVIVPSTWMLALPVSAGAGVRVRYELVAAPGKRM